MEPLAELFLQAYKDGKCADVELMFFEHSIKASKFVLVCHSPVFEKIFEESQFCKTKRVQIDNCRYEVMDELVRGMYCGRLEANDLDFAIELYKAAETYETDHLKRLALDLIERTDRWSDRDVLTLLQLAYDKNLDTLFTKVIEYIRNHDVIINSLPGFKDIEHNAQLFNRLFNQLVIISKSTTNNSDSGWNDNNWTNTWGDSK